MISGVTTMQLTAIDNASAVINRVRGASDQLGQSWTKMQQLLGMLGVGLSVGYFISLTKGAIDAADKINDLSQSTGIAVQALGKYKLATEQSGTTLEGLAKGVKGLANAFAEHGTELKAAGINATTTDGRMRQLADIFSQMPDGMEKTTLAVKLFGKSGMDLIPMLNMGSRGLEETAEKSAKYAAVLATLAPQADKFNDTMKELGMASKVASLSLINDALPAMSMIAAAMAVAAHESGMLKAAWVGFGGIAWEGIFKPLIAIIRGTMANLMELNAKMLQFFGANDAAAREFQRAAMIWKEIAAMQEPPDAHKPEKVFDTDKWVAQYKKMLAALGIEGKKAASVAAVLTEQELLQKAREFNEKRGILAEEEATKAGQARVDAENAIREQMLRDDENSARIAYDARAEMDRAYSQIRLQEIDKRTKAEIDAAKKAEDFRKDQEKEITRGLTDALMRGFDAGKGFARNFWDSMIAMAKTIVLRPIIEAALSPVSAAAASGSSMFSSAAGSIAGRVGMGMGTGGVGSIGAGGVMTAAPVYEAGALVAAGETAGLFTSAGASAALAAIPVVGWAALAVAALYSAGAFSGSGGPKNPYLGIMAGGTAVTQSDFGASSLNAAQAADLSAWLAQLPLRLQTAIDGMVESLSPGATPQQAWTQLQARIVDTAKSLNLTTDEMAHLMSVSDQLTRNTAFGNTQRQLSIQLYEAQGATQLATDMKRGDALTALALAGNDEAVRLQKLIWATEDAAVADKALADARTAATAAGEEAIKSFASTMQAEADKTIAAMQARSQAADAALSKLDTARQAVWTAYDQIASQLDALATKFGGFGKSLHDLQQSLLLGSSSPLLPMQQFAEAQKQFRDLLLKSKGDPTLLSTTDAFAGLGGASQAYLSAGQTAFAHGGQFSTVFAEVQKGLGEAVNVADTQADIAQKQLDAQLQMVEQLVGVRGNTGSLAVATSNFQKALADFATAVAAAGGLLSDATRAAAANLHTTAYQPIPGSFQDPVIVAQSQTIANLANAANESGPPPPGAWGPTQSMILAANYQPDQYAAAAAAMGWNSIPRFEAGTPYVPRTGLALVHQGERITPAGGSNDLVREIADLKVTVARLLEQIRNGQDTQTDTLDASITGSGRRMASATEKVHAIGARA